MQTAVAVEGGYECTSCGRAWPVGLVRVPRAWGRGGEAMEEAASLALDFPEAATIRQASLAEQTLALASELPERPVVLGGCCCAHVGAVEGLAARHDELWVVWFDAHGDLNTRESSPSGNEWGMPFRMVLDSGASDPRRAALVGARDLDPPEVEFVREHGLDRAVEEAAPGGAAVYVALDLDVLEPGEAAPFMPVEGGLSLADAEARLRVIADRTTVVGAGFTGATPDPRNAAAVARLARALGLAEVTRAREAGV